MTTLNLSKNKHHCMIVHAHYPRAETRVQRQAEALVNHGYKVDVICLGSSQEAPLDICNNVRVIRLPVEYKHHDGVFGKFIEYLQFFFLVMLKVAQLHRQQPYGTVQIHNLPDFLIFAGWVPKLFGAKLILDLHDLMPEFYQARFGGDGQNVFIRLLRLQEKLSCGFANHVVTVSELWRQTIIKRSVPADKCSVVMNVADRTIFRPPKVPQDYSQHRDNGDLHLIYHGTVTYRYGVDLVLMAMAQVRPQIPNIRLTIHGGGQLVETLKRMTKELDLVDHVHFSTTFVPVEELPSLIKSGDIGLAPYRADVFTDGIVPTKLMEYAALGMPAIAARTSAIEMYFKDTMVEFFMPGDVDGLARCILTLYQDQARLAELTSQAKTFNEQYNWDKLGNAYVDLIDRLNNRNDSLSARENLA